MGVGRLRRAHVGVTQQIPDRHDRNSGIDENGRVASAQVVEPQVLDLGLAHDRRQGPPYLVHMPGLRVAREDVGAHRATLFPHPTKKLHCGAVQEDMPGLARFGNGEVGSLVAEVDVFPAEGEDLHFAKAREKQQRNGFGGNAPLFDLLMQYRREAGQFLAGQHPLAGTVLPEFRDAARGVLRSVPDVDRPRVDAGELGEVAVRRDGRDIVTQPQVQLGNVPLRDARQGLLPEGRDQPQFDAVFHIFVGAQFLPGVGQVVLGHELAEGEGLFRPGALLLRVQPLGEQRLGVPNHLPGQFDIDGGVLPNGQGAFDPLVGIPMPEAPASGFVHGHPEANLSLVTVLDVGRRVIRRGNRQGVDAPVGEPKTRAVLFHFFPPWVLGNEESPLEARGGAFGGPFSRSPVIGFLGRRAPTPWLLGLPSGWGGSWSVRGPGGGIGRIL